MAAMPVVVVGTLNLFLVVFAGVTSLPGVAGLYLDPLNDKSIDEHTAFAQYIRQYNKPYEATNKIRFAAFQRTLEEIQRLRAEQRHAQFDLNEFSDLTVEERKRMRCGIDKQTRSSHFGTDL